MTIFDELFSTIIGILLVALPGGGDASTDTTAAAQVGASSTVPTLTIEERGVIEQVRSALVRYQTKIEARSRVASSDDYDSDDTRSRGRGEDDLNDEFDDSDGRVEGSATARVGSEDQDDTERSTSSRREDRDDEDDDMRHSDDDNEDEDEDREDDRRGSGSSGGTTGSAGTTQSGTGSAQGSVTGSIVAGLTLSEVAKHNSASSCYTIVNGNVYDVTSWISKHPGGQGAIKGMCGVDASADFNGQHSGDRRPETELAGFKLGALVR
ncbi:MAG: cytochrome b5 domain-containing protein [Candidatus Pacebacteria bacterium]|nr:cytochrome b5 domain-containing protein [Candidatus Paceibacterota bacterium]